MVKIKSYENFPLWIPLIAVVVSIVGYILGAFILSGADVTFVRDYAPSLTAGVFTLTGAVIPDQIQIQIMTVTGKVVREITQDELGPIRIGNNISEFAWDGRDEYGDQLANGVYFYRVTVRSNGLQLDRRGTSADKAFKKGFGKIYLLR